MADLPLPGLGPTDPLNRLSEAARRRISGAHAEADLIRTRALAAIEARYRSEPDSDKDFSEYHTFGQAGVEWAEAKMQAARTVLVKVSAEFQAAGISGRELRQIMQNELDSAVYSLELTTLQRDLLWQELGLYRYGSRVQAGPARRQNMSFDESLSDPLQTQQRLCWWRDRKIFGLLDGLPEGKKADPDARYSYERAQSELQYQAHLKSLKSVPRSSNERLIASTLECYIGQFLSHALCAFGDSLLDKQVPATEAVRAFEQHADDLLARTFKNKWQLDLLHLELTEDEAPTNQFWDVHKETAANAQREFEGLLWKAELDRAASPVARTVGAECGDEMQPTQQVGATETSRDESTLMASSASGSPQPSSPTSGSPVSPAALLPGELGREPGGLVAPGVLATPATVTNAADTTKRARAETVAKLINELNILKPQMLEDDQEYNLLRAQYPNFLAFRIAAERPDLRTKILAIQGSTRHIRLAQELAAAHHGRRLTTIQTDWKDFKPAKFKRWK